MIEDEFHIPDSLSGAMGMLLALHFLLCAGAEMDGTPYPDPAECLDMDGEDMKRALGSIMGLLEMPDERPQRQAVVRLLAAMANLIEVQGTDLELVFARVRNPDALRRGKILAELTGGRNLRIVATAELPDFDGMPAAECKQVAMSVSSQMLRNLAGPLQDSVMRAAGYERAAEPAEA